MSSLIINTPESIILNATAGHSISLIISPTSLPGPQGATGPQGIKGDTGIGIPSGGVAGQVLAKNSNTDYDSHWITAAGMGDMLSAVYDPTGKNADAFDVDNHVSGITNRVFTATEKTKLSGIATGATAYTDAMADARVTSGITGKVDKVTGKQLSTEDYTTTEKNKLSGIAEGAEVNVNADWNASSGDAQILNKPTIPTAVSDLSNDSGFVIGSGLTKITVGTTEPSTPSTGDLWVDTN
jgi:Cu/Ag efflux protein CusF